MSRSSIHAAAWLSIALTTMPAWASQDPVRLFTVGETGLEVRSDAWQTLRDVAAPTRLDTIRLGPGLEVDLEVERFSVATSSRRFVVGRPGGKDERLDF
ncbi:MAG: hypothetical protein ACYTGC_16475, partial [Planctomycetota bacterium]